MNHTEALMVLPITFLGCQQSDIFFQHDSYLIHSVKVLHSSRQLLESMLSTFRRGQTGLRTDFSLK